MKKNIVKSPKVDQILGINFTSSQKPELLKLVEDRLDRKTSFFIVTPNPEIVVAAQSDTFLRRILNSAEISLVDGAGIVFAAKFLKNTKFERIAGRVFFEDLIALSNKNGSKVFLLGGSNAVIEKSIATLKSKYSDLSVDGMAGAELGQDGKPKNQKEELKDIDVIARINHFKPDILFVGFGAPKQEKWVFQNREKLKVTGVMVVGGVLDVISGYKSAPPYLFQKIGIEWLWRLLQEPSRLGRIVTAVVIFPLLVLREKIRSH